MTRLSPSKIAMKAPTEPRVLFKNTQNLKLAEVTFNNPKALNAFDCQMGELLIKEVDKWEEQGTKIAIFKGIGGKAFCAGGDVKS